MLLLFSVIVFTLFLILLKLFFLLLKVTMLMNYLLTSGPALVFEGEEAMLAAITENPMSFKVISCFMTSPVSNNNDEL